ncbi:hypothetical protein M2226_003667 [Bradyrhizobium elkanii]|uniref:hypothetical protein n=1 Tax=Bradyrhizobium elkanii TaxID=29448 RepID=UPI002225E45B|nr:hypothetical protein [Bradyrhizobium elkanii]MCW2124923.1 hypothetical protein [Bradyrhizobium elkanii]MCW2171669.1 hypothetical protein [Bradyrhizobium elkanii]
MSDDNIIPVTGDELSIKDNAGRRDLVNRRRRDDEFEEAMAILEECVKRAYCIAEASGQTERVFLRLRNVIESLPTQESSGAAQAQSAYDTSTGG